MNWVGPDEISKCLAMADRSVTTGLAHVPDRRVKMTPKRID